ncbi:MAG TPA: universal stress protein [Bacteroidales bacterium]|nr:universal stress protein [Bacteroidales bacterium]
MKTYKIKNMLLPVDFSKSNHSAVKTAVAICKRQNSKLTLIHVIDKTNMADSPPSSDVGFVTFKEFQKHVHKELKALASQISKSSKLEVNSYVEIGTPSEIIRNYAEKDNASIIVMGAHGKSGNTDKMGSVAFNVVTGAACPVMVVPGNWNHEKFNKIVYPIRMDQKVFEKFNYIQPIIEKNNSELIIAGLANKDNTEHISKTVFSIDLLREMCQEEKIEYSTIVFPSNNFSSKVVETANKINADLIVISSHINYDSEVNFLEAFARTILDESKCPVLCISPLINKRK